MGAECGRHCRDVSEELGVIDESADVEARVARGDVEERHVENEAEEKRGKHAALAVARPVFHPKWSDAGALEYDPGNDAVDRHHVRKNAGEARHALEQVPHGASVALVVC